MNNKLTSIIRWILDALIPPILRDNKYFMYPLFFIWYKGKNVSKLMDFKLNVAGMEEEQFIEHYKIYDSVGSSRNTDINQKSLDHILDNLKHDQNNTILDIGCGKGYILSELMHRGFSKLEGSDIVNDLEVSGIEFHQANIEKLPFKNGEFDVVMCHHTIEHVVNCYKAVLELKRIAKKKIIITTPKQKFNKYTFDLHINFFPMKINLVSLMNIDRYECFEYDGDWLFIGYLAGDIGQKDN